MGERERVGNKGESEREDEGREGGKRKKMHKQMLALGIDAISSVSQLMTNSIERREEQKDSTDGVSESKTESRGTE